MPIPRKDKKNINQSEQIDEEIEDLFKNSDASETLEDSNSTSLSAEEFVLKKIDKN